MNILKAKRKLGLFFSEISALDLRALSLFRIALSFILILNLLLRMRDLTAHYTSEGVLPRSILNSTEGASYWPFNLQLISDSYSFQLGFFIFFIACAVWLGLGIFSRVAVAACWFLFVCLETRNPLILDGGDTLLRLLLFWSIFLPLDQFYSLRKQKRLPPLSLSLASFCFISQIVSVYFFTALLKTGNEWQTKGTAIFSALNIEQLVTPFGRWLREFPEFLKMMTPFTWWIELLLPFALFIPAAKYRFRLLAVAILIGLHLMFAATLKLALFPWVDIVALLALLPLSRNLPSRDTKSSLAGIIVNVWLCLCLFAVICWNVQSLQNQESNSYLAKFTTRLHLDQKWQMFAPHPLKDDGWYIAAAELSNGKVVDIFRNGELVSEEIPSEGIGSTFKNERWRKYMEYLTLFNHPKIIAPYLSYVCRSWNKDESRPRAVELEIDFMLRKLDEEGNASPIEKVPKWRGKCPQD